jgi:hypothetical protein
VVGVGSLIDGVPYKVVADLPWAPYPEVLRHMVKGAVSVPGGAPANISPEYAAVLGASAGAGLEDMRPEDISQIPTNFERLPDGAVTDCAAGRNITMHWALSSAWRHWGWSEEAVRELAWAQYPLVAEQGEKPFPGHELDSILKKVFRKPQGTIVQDDPKGYAAAMRDLVRIGWSDAAINACRAAELEVA